MATPVGPQRTATERQLVHESAAGSTTLDDDQQLTEEQALAAMDSEEESHESGSRHSSPLFGGEENEDDRLLAEAADKVLTDPLAMDALESSLERMELRTEGESPLQDAQEMDTQIISDNLQDMAADLPRPPPVPLVRQDAPQDKMDNILYKAKLYMDRTAATPSVEGTQPFVPTSENAQQTKETPIILRRAKKKDQKGHGCYSARE